MRISDWSSDVCSSDLLVVDLRAGLGGGVTAVLPVELTHERAHALGVLDQAEELGVGGFQCLDQLAHRVALDRACGGLHRQLRAAGVGVEGDRARQGLERRAGELVQLLLHRSEEHTSELQSLMRISYAVFCLKKKQRIDKT